MEVKLIDNTRLTLDSFDELNKQNKQMVLSIHCSSCNISVLPEWMSEFVNLQEFDCEYNQITSIDPLRQCTQLIVLVCDYNELREIPEWIGELNNLEVLSCSHNKIISIPNSIGLLTEMKYFYCAHNRIYYLPQSMRNLKHLQKLICFNNRIREIPNFDIPNLEICNHIISFSNYDSEPEERDYSFDSYKYCDDDE
jgi:Leucine-rich repeat (LRR) protein